jgi:hypothetical protein
MQVFEISFKVTWHQTPTLIGCNLLKNIHKKRFI